MRLKKEILCKLKETTGFRWVFPSAPLRYIEWREKIIVFALRKIAGKRIIAINLKMKDGAIFIPYGKSYVYLDVKVLAPGEFG